MRVSILYQNKEILMDGEDYIQLPEGFTIKFDKGGYPLIYFYSTELRKETNFRLHRWVLKEPSGLLVDHINGNVLDSRKSNLRSVTVTQNAQNKKKAKLNHLGKVPSSSYKGVCKAASGKWQSQIKVKGRSVYLGQFLTEVEAHKAYTLAAKTYFGEYARAA